MESTKKNDIVAIGKALVAATTKASSDRDPAPLATALSEALAANLPHNCAAALRARKLLDTLERAKLDAREQAPKGPTVRKKRQPRKIKLDTTKVGYCPSNGE